MTPPTPDQLLEALDPEQREVALALNGPVCVLAGAGTGKTRAITHRIAYGVRSGQYQPNAVLAVTFTARAAGELRTRLRELGVVGVQGRTFHAAALRQLRYFWPQAVGGGLPPLAEHKARLVAEAAMRQRLEVDRATIRDLSAEVEWAKVSMLTPDTYPAALTVTGRTPPAGFDPATVARVIRGYEEIKDAAGVIDFEDVMLLLVGILTEHPGIASEVAKQYRHFVVDEYQDVSGLQQRLLNCWLAGRDELCVVGDASQTIYSFAGAHPRHLLDFKRSYPDAKVITLVRDYRSTPQVVALANQLLDRAPAAAAKGRVQLISQCQPGPQPLFTAYPDDEAEAAGIAGKLKAIIDSGTPASEVAVLFRTNGHSAGLEQALTQEGVPYLVRGGERFFNRDEVRRAMVLLRGSARSDDGSKPLGELVRDLLGDAGWSHRPPSTSGAVRDRWESLQALVRLADQLAEADDQARLRDLVADLQQRAEAQHAPTVEGVTLTSLHAAKGLEWDVVALVGISEGLMPITFAQAPEAIEEERRLLYVGVTRARHRLLISWATARTPGGRATRNPSRFLDGLHGDPAAGSASPEGRQATTTRPKLARTCRVCRKPLSSTSERKIGRCDDCPPTYDDATFEALRSWRKEVAEVAKVPAYVVFTDSTLIAIAEARPAAQRDLLRIPGVGPAKWEKYGRQVLAVMGSAPVKSSRENPSE